MTKSYSLPLSTDELLAEARRITGIDIVDNEVVEPLTVLVTSINNESQLHEAGAIAKQNKLLRLLSNRLRMLRDFTAHPEIADEKIENPVFILGMARSGTTKTHRVLSATGDFNFMPLWQVQYPALFTGDRDESPQARVDATDEYCRWLDETAPEIKLGHSFKTHAAEEDLLELDKNKTVSLRESVRRAEWEEREQQRLERRNRLRAFRGLPPLASLDEVKDLSAEDQEKDEEGIRRIMLEESANILADDIRAKRPRTALVN